MVAALRSLPPTYRPTHPRKRGPKILTPNPRKSLAEVHGNRTHLPPSSDGTPDLKSGGPTSEPRTSASIMPPGCSVSRARRPAFRVFSKNIINPGAIKDKPGQDGGRGRRPAPGRHQGEDAGPIGRFRQAAVPGGHGWSDPLARQTRFPGRLPGSNTLIRQLFMGLSAHL
jgi:hypothetical protein